MFIPQIGVRGLYTLLPPFSDKLISGAQYVCVGVRTIGELIGKGELPFDSYYKPYGISSEVYTTDVANNVTIVTLDADGRHTVYVPSSYISGYPEIGGVSYVSLMLGAQLGPVKEGTDLSLLTDKVKQVILQYQGITTDVKIIAASVPKLLSHTSSNAIESARAAQKNIVATDYTDKIQLQNQNALLLEKIALLENYIKSKNL